MAAAAAKRGLFVLFEGVDRCGKTTQARRLAEALNGGGDKAVFMRFPGGWRCGNAGEHGCATR
jgi:dTMP kinase